MDNNETLLIFAVLIAALIFWLTVLRGSVAQIV